MIYWGLVVAQLVTFAAYVVVTAGAALLQQKANTLTLFDGLDPEALEATIKVYNEVFQSSTYVIPDPQQPQYQFQYQWWIIEYQFFLFAITAVLTLFPAFIPRGRIVALTFLATALVLVMDNVNALFFLLRNPTAIAVFEEYRIAVAQAGLIMVGVGNGLTIIFMGLFVLSIPVARGANWFLAGGGRRMDEEEATAAAAERIAAAAEDGTSLPVRLATDVVRFLYGGTGRREPADGGVVSASLLNAKPAVGGIGVESRGGGVLRVLFTVASDAVAVTVVRWRHELRRCVDSTAVFDVLSDREEAQHQALWPAFLAAKVAGKRAQFHRARLVVDGERMANMIYWGLVVAQLVTFAAYAVVTAGAALLQEKANNLTLFDGLDPEALEATIKVYNEVFQSSTYVIPYPQQPQYQFQYQWWIIEYQFFLFAITAVLTLFPAFIPRGRIVALTFLATALVLVMDNVNALFFLLRNPTAIAVFEEYRIATAQAGLIMVGVGNGLTIIFMGLYEHEASEAAAPHAHDMKSYA
ncbi:hypothetical protein FOA52_010388 [Chlamydomonas sp. UWO 241]|nr:hypothetical protein FOA52_010388 [Chlamydomonas sp. UWO 241]